MKKEKAYQLEVDGARFYEQNFVPALFKNWALSLVEKLDLRESDHLLDVACGTGIVARTGKGRGIKNLKITGCDINDGMLQVAEEIEPEITWINGQAESLPFDDQVFDKISCQFGFMFFDNQAKSINEMTRVLKDKGRIILGIWDTIESNEGYYDLWQILENTGGRELGEVLLSPFSLGNKSEIIDVINKSNASNYRINTEKNFVEFSSIKHWIDCDVKASPIAGKITDSQYADLLKAGEEKLERYVTRKGTVRFQMSGHIVEIEK